MAPDTAPDASRLIPFTVGDWLVEPKACRISRGDAVVKLRPQLADLLVCLARRAGQIALRDEILAEVWPEQYIAESGLSRCVAELRQSLQDDAQEPRFIETFPKRGYRLIAPVVWQDHVEPVPAVPAEVPPVHANATAEPPDVAAAGGDNVVTSTDPSAGDRPAGDRPAGDRPVMRSRRGVRVLAAVGLLAIGIVVVTLLMRTPTNALTDRDTVVLADVSNTTGDRVFDDTLRLALAVDLEQAPFLRILPREVIREAVVRTGRPPDERVIGPLALDICRREGAAVLLTGSIARLGTRYAVGVEAIACRTGEEVSRALVETNSKEEVLTALEQAARRIREKLGESRESLRQHDVPLVRATTSSLEALKALTLGDDSRDHSRIEEALSFYRQATELDPGFALAWARRGAAARNRGLIEEAMPAFRKAYELRDRVSPPEAFYIAGHYYMTVAGEPQKAIEAYQAWKRMYPGSAVPPTNLAALYNNSMGQFDAALTEAREAVRLAPHSALAYNNLIGAYRGLGRIAEAKTIATDALRRGVVDRSIHAQLLYLALNESDRASIDREVKWAVADPMAMLLTLRLCASAAMDSGRLLEARQLWAEALKKAEEIGPARRVAETRLFQAEAEALVGDARAARSAVEAALAANREPATLVRSAIVYALVGDVVRAQAILDDLSRQPVPEPAALLVWLPVAQALVQAGQGRADDAIGIMQKVSRFNRGVDFRLVPLCARGLVSRSARRPSDAVAAFDEVLYLRAIDPVSPWVTFARLGRARALRELGQVRQSLAAYDVFLDSWKHADPDAPLLAVARRERAAIGLR